MEDGGKSYPTLPANYVTIVDLQKRWMKQQQQQQQQEEEKQNNRKKEESNYSFSNKDEDDKHANQKSQFQKPNRSKFDNGNPNSVIRRPVHRNFHGKKRLEDEKIAIAKKVSSNPISEASENNAAVTKVEIDDRVKQMDDRKVEDDKVAKKMKKKKKKKKNKKNRRVQKQNHPMKSNECCEVEERENQGKEETDMDDQTVEEKDNQETMDDQTAEIEPKLKKVSVSSRKEWGNGRSRAAIKWRKPESGTMIWEVKRVKEFPAIRVEDRESKGEERVEVDINSKPTHVMNELSKKVYKCYRKHREGNRENSPRITRELDEERESKGDEGVEVDINSKPAHVMHGRREIRQKHWKGNGENSPIISRELDEERENEGGKSTAVVEGYRGGSRGYSGFGRRRMGWSWRRNEGGLVWVKKTEVKS